MSILERPIPVIEIFGPVIQGEGITAGCQTHFLRTGGCDYKCSWCDTLYAVVPEQVKMNSTPMTQDQIVDALVAKRQESGVSMVTISGGNPAMWNLSEAVKKLRLMGWKIVVETQGTLYQDWFAWCNIVTVSPKPPSSDMVTDHLKLTNFLWRLKSHTTTEVCLKVVVFDEIDFLYALDIFRLYDADWKYLQPGTVQTMKDGYQRDLANEILIGTRWVIDRLKQETEFGDVRVMPQVHSLLYGYARGV